MVLTGKQGKSAPLRELAASKKKQKGGSRRPSEIAGY
jgi:hypothetical protein